MERRPAYWTHDDKAVEDIGEHLYYFAPANRAPGPYLKQKHVTAIIDIAADGTLAGVELIDGMPPPPAPRERMTEQKALWLTGFACVCTGLVVLGLFWLFAFLYPFMVRG